MAARGRRETGGVRLWGGGAGEGIVTLRGSVLHLCASFAYMALVSNALGSGLEDASVWGLKLLVYATLRYSCVRP